MTDETPEDKWPLPAKQVHHMEVSKTPELPVPAVVWRIFLILSVFLYSSFTILVHLCEVDGHLSFRTTAVVLLTESLKFVLSVCLFSISRRPYGQPNNHRRSLLTDIQLELQQYSHQTPTPGQLPSVDTLAPLPFSPHHLLVIVLPFTVPAVLYAVNNNLGMYLQLEMDPATYQVLGNFKILSTATLFRLIIKRPISTIQWFSLLLLLIAGFAHSYANLFTKNSFVSSTFVDVVHTMHITTLGIILISIYCTISGLSGVYTEYVMKQRAQMNIHLQNALLYIFGVLVNTVMYFYDVHRAYESDFWNLTKGFSIWTWLLIVTQAICGIFMGFVMKFATNITRLFIISSAMIVTTFMAMLVFGLRLDALYIVSFLLVTLALYLYHR
ncbi:unnamed protein product [Dicrocoelium dendriticum]|nr:unnamed protein product [Dicrocoelium dendriticum]